LKRKRELSLTAVGIPRSRFKNELPAGAEVHNLFRAVFVPTYERWVGMQANPWVIPDPDAIEALQTIWDAIYVDLPFTVTGGSGDAVFERVSSLTSDLVKYLTTF
jgi:hypothetical protein